MAAEPAVAIAVRGTGALRLETEPAAEVRSETVGSELATVTLTAAEVAVAAAESSTVAVSATLPAVVGVHATV